MQSLKLNSQCFSLIMRRIPMAFLRRAKGSWLPVGTSPMAKRPQIVSNLSAKDTMVPVVDSGRSAPLATGMYCSRMASDTTDSSPSSLA